MIVRRVYTVLACWLLLALFPFAFGAAQETPEERPRYKSPLGLAVDPTGQFAYVALHTSNTLAVVDLRTGCILCEIPIGKKPYDVALARGVAYVTCEADDTLVAVDVAARKVTQVFQVGQAPRGVSADAAGSLIQVVCHDEKVLWTARNLVGSSPGKPVFSKTPIPPQPEGNYARASSPHLVVNAKAEYLPGPQPFNFFTYGQSVLNGRVRPPVSRLTAFNPAFDFDYHSPSMDLVAHTLPHWFTPTEHAHLGRVFTNAFSFFLDRSSPAAVVLLDEPDKGYPDPTDVVVKLPKQASGQTTLAPLKEFGKSAAHPLQGAKVFISSGGADTVLVLDLDRAAKHAQAIRVPGNPPMGMMGSYGGMMGGGMMGGGMMGGGMMGGGMMGGGMMGGGMMGGGMMGGGMMGGGMMGGGMMGWQGGPNLLADLRASGGYILARLPTQANPRRMVLTPDGKTLVVSNHLADSLTLIDTENLRTARHIDLGGPRPDNARRGEILFHSAKLTFQQQFTCASCHPNNGSDGLIWNTAKNGQGEFLNTRALHGLRDTGPFGWRGESETLDRRAKNTMSEVHKHALSNAAASAIAAYLETLNPPRPLPQKLTDLAAIARGKALFQGRGNCKSCHHGSAFTSASPRAVILDHARHLTPFDVPSLRGVARTAPYLHDGRAATLEEIFLKHNLEKRHGRAHELTPSELSNLIAYLKSL